MIGTLEVPRCDPHPRSFRLGPLAFDLYRLSDRYVLAVYHRSGYNHTWSIRRAS